MSLKISVFLKLSTISSNSKVRIKVDIVDIVTINHRTGNDFFSAI